MIGLPSSTTLIVGGVLVASLAGLGWYAKHETERAAVAESLVKDAESRSNAYRLALDQQNEQLAQSQRGYEQLRAQTDKRIRAYEQSLVSNQRGMDWDRLPVPAAVAQRLCDYYPGEGGMPADPKAVHRPAPDSCPGADRYFTTGDIWRWTERLLEVIERANADRASLK